MSTEKCPACTAAKKEQERRAACFPDLLDACELALAAFDGAPARFSTENLLVIQRLRDAIQKATGEQP